jgi:hypothetical protein
LLTLAIVAASAVTSLLLLAGRHHHLLIGLIVLAGWSQAALIGITQSSAFQYLDDVPAAVLIVAASIRALTASDRGRHLALLLMFALGILAGVGLARSPDMAVGFAQARQVLMPLGLVFAGFVFREDVRWRKVQGSVLVFAGLTVLWVIAEEIMQAPLVDPVWYYLNVVGGSYSGMRQGLPPAYFADGVAGTVPAFRPGGPFMNPPVMGFLLGLGAFAAVARLRGFGRVLMLALIGGALLSAYARAGILIFLVVTAIYFIWLKVGKYAGIVVALGLGGYLASTFLEQGNTASHSDGLFSGLTLGVQSPIGLGFGTTGYQAALEGTSTGVGSESLLGLYFAWMGLPMIVAVLVILLRLWRLLVRVPKVDSLPVWVAIAFILAAASSESASSIASTPVLWLLVGAALAVPVPDRPAPAGPIRRVKPAAISPAYAKDRRFSPAALGKP